MLEIDEREALEAIRDNPDYSNARRQRATILLMADIGPNGSPVPRQEISKTVAVSMTSIVNLVEKAMDRGVIESVMGPSREGWGRGEKQKRKLSPEVEEQIAADYSTGEFTQAVLAERFGVSKGKISTLIKEQVGNQR